MDRDKIRSIHPGMTREEIAGWHAWAGRIAGEAAAAGRAGFLAMMDLLAAAGFRTWWLAPMPGEELSGPWYEAEAQARWQDGREAWPQQQVWRGADPQHVQPAHPSWTPGQPARDQAEQGTAQLTRAGLAGQLGALPGMRPGYRDAVLAEAARRLLAEPFCRCCTDNECECDGSVIGYDPPAPPAGTD